MIYPLSGLTATMEAPNSQRSTLGDRRLAVVSGYALKPLTPRGQRTQWLCRSFERDRDVGADRAPRRAARRQLRSGQRASSLATPRRRRGPDHAAGQMGAVEHAPAWPLAAAGRGGAADRLPVVAGHLRRSRPAPRRSSLCRRRRRSLGADLTRDRHQAAGEIPLLAAPSGRSGATPPARSSPPGSRPR